MADAFNRALSPVCHFDKVGFKVCVATQDGALLTLEGIAKTLDGHVPVFVPGGRDLIIGKYNHESPVSKRKGIEHDSPLSRTLRSTCRYEERRFPKHGQHCRYPLRQQRQSYSEFRLPTRLVEQRLPGRVEGKGSVLPGSEQGLDDVQEVSQMSTQSRFLVKSGFVDEPVSIVQNYPFSIILFHNAVFHIFAMSNKTDHTCLPAI